MDQLNHFINNMTDEEFDSYPVQHLIDNLGVRIPVRLVATIHDNGVAYSVYLEHDRTPIFIPIPPEPAAMPAPYIDDYPADEMEDVEERVSPRQDARRAASRAARISRRADRRAARQAFEQQQLRRQQPGLFANPHNIFQQHQQQHQQPHQQPHQDQQPHLPMQRPQSPVHQQPPNPASRRQRRKASRLSRERREARIRAGYVVGGKTRRHRRRHYGMSR